jgi:acetate kinase
MAIPAELTRASQQIQIQPQAVAHRIVHAAAIVDSRCASMPVIGTTERLSALAPLHNPQTAWCARH